MKSFYSLRIAVLLVFSIFTTKLIGQAFTLADSVSTFPTTITNVNSGPSNGGVFANGMQGTCSSIACCSMLVYKVTIPERGSLRIEFSSYTPLAQSIIAYRSLVPNPTSFSDLNYISSSGNFCGYRDTMQLGRFYYWDGAPYGGNPPQVAADTTTVFEPTTGPGDYYILVFTENNQASINVGATTDITFEFKAFCPDGFSCGIVDTSSCGSTYVTPSGKTLTSSGSYKDTLVGVAAGGLDSLITINLDLNPVPTIAISVDSSLSVPGANDGQLSALASNGTAPYTYSWSNGEVFTENNIAYQGFELSNEDTWNYTADPGPYATETDSIIAGSEDIWNIIREFTGDIDNPTQGNYFWGTQDLRNSNGGRFSKHYLTFDPVNVSNYSEVAFSFDYYSDGFDASDSITYELELDNGTSWGNSINNLGKNNDAWLTVLDSIPDTTTYVRFRIGVYNDGSTDYSGWDNIKLSTANSVLRNLSAGSYTVTATDASGCTAVGSEVMSIGGAVLSATITLDSNVSCNGFSDGGATASASGGTIPYTYAWSNGASNASISGLSATTYTVTVTDNSGATDIASITITEPNALTVTTSTTTTPCGASTGTATVTPTGGTAPFVYLWDSNAGSQTSATATNLAVGTYNVTVTDANACTNSASTTINSSSSLSASIAVDSNVSCIGGSNGGLTASATGGTLPYNYLWSNSATTASITGVSALTYLVTITDGAGCVVIDSAVVSELPGLAVNAFKTDLLCNGGNDGGARVSIFYDGFENAQTTPSTYQSNVDPIPGLPEWRYENMLLNERLSIFSSGAVDRVHTGNVALGLDQGNFGENSIILSLDMSAHQGRTDLRFAYWAYSSGDENSSIDVVSFKGDTSDSWELLSDWNVGANGVWKRFDVDLDSALAAHGQQLTANTQFKFSQSDNFSFPTDGVIFDDINIYHEGLSYAWSNGATTDTINNLSAGPYSVTVTDVNGCSAVASTSVAEPPLLIAVATIDSTASCNGAADGGLTASASGGTAPYTYAWSNGATTASITGITVGTYTATITDNNGCTATDNSTITEPATLVASTVVDSNISCNGLSDGGVTASASGGTAPYTYARSNGATTASITGIAVGTYTATITDDNGCTATDNSTITEPATLVAATVVDSNAFCNGSSDGGATASATGGTAPYTYAWSNGATTASITGVASGTYTVTITDNNGCSDTDNSTITEPTALVAATVVDSNVSCNGLSNGGVTASASGGTAPYTYAWSNGATTASITGIAVGTYTATITDNNGCTATDNSPITEPATLVAATVVDSNVSCNGLSNGGVTASASGGTAPYTYAWSNGATTASITGIAVGTYTATITDNNGCTATDNSTITEPVALLASVVVDSNASCNGFADGGLTASASGGTMPYTYTWSNAATTASITGVSASNYSVTVTDGNGCSATASNTVTEPLSLVAAVTVDSNVTVNAGTDGGATASASGGTMPYTYLWSNGSTTASITGLYADSYDVTVTDGNGCSATNTAIITEPMPTLASLVITEIMYNPPESGVDSLEYIEIYNNGSTSVDLNNYSFGQGVNYTFERSFIDAGGVILVAVDTLAIRNVFNVTADFQWTSGGLSNGGEDITLIDDFGRMVDTVDYDDNTPWPSGTPGPDGDGTSIELMDINSDNNMGSNWTASAAAVSGQIINGSQLFGSPKSVTMDLITTQVNVSCFGGNDATATLSASGGVGPYSYNWNGSFNTSSSGSVSISNLTAGTYYATVTDNGGTSIIDTVVISEPPLITSSIAQTACDTFTWSLTGMTYDSSGIYMDTLSAMNGCDSIVNLDLTINYTL
ncbi:MAG: lamin tail domain-containing protein, partial [Vicingaceae bacterium]